MATETPGQAEKPSRKRAVLWLFAVMLCTSSVHLIAGSPDAGDLRYDHFKSEVEKAFGRLQNEEKPTSAKLSVDRMRASGFYDPENSWSSIIRLWIAGQEDWVQLLWWPKDDRETRMLIVALSWSSNPPPDKGNEDWPASAVNFPAQSRRFAGSEGGLRAEEIVIVRERLPEICQLLASNFRKISDPRAESAATRCMTVATRLKTGRQAAVNPDAGIQSAISSYPKAQGTRIEKVIHVEGPRGQRQAIVASEPTDDGNAQQFFLLDAECRGWRVREHYWLYNGQAITPKTGLSQDLSPEQFVKAWRAVRDHPEVVSRKLVVQTVQPLAKGTGGEDIYSVSTTDPSGQIDFCVRVGINPEGEAYVKSVDRSLR